MDRRVGIYKPNWTYYYGLVCTNIKKISWKMLQKDFKWYEQYALDGFELEIVIIYCSCWWKYHISFFRNTLDFCLIICCNTFMKCFQTVASDNKILSFHLQLLRNTTIPWTIFLFFLFSLLFLILFFSFFDCKYL